MRLFCGFWIVLLASAPASAVAAQGPVLLDSTALGPIRACSALAVVDRTFPQARDTVIAGEVDSRWPAKVVSLNGREWVVVESSWADTNHIWTIRTNSPRFRTRRGYRVGMRIGDLIAKGEHFTAEIGEGQLALTLVSEGLGVGIDARSSARFPNAWPAGKDATSTVDPDATITVLTAGRRCPH